MEENQLTSAVFSNPTILANVFRFLPVRDLKSVRLVSSSWKDVCSPVFRRRTVVFFDGDDGDKDLSEVSRFLETFATTPARRLPIFRNFKFRLFIYDDDSEGVLDALWEKFGPSMESVWFYGGRMVGLETLRNVLFNNMCPNLKRINIDRCDFFDTFDRRQKFGTQHEGIAALDENVRVNRNLTSLEFSSAVYSRFGSGVDFPTSWEEVFMAFPNIKEIKLVNVCASKTDSILEIASCMKTKTPSSIQWEKLNIINTNGRLVFCTRDSINLIYSLGLSLKELSIPLGINVTSQEMNRLLRQQMNVEKLVLDAEPHFVPMMIFPSGVTFNHLRFLEISVTISESMGFIQFMPNLSTVKLSGRDTNLGSNNAITRTDINFAQMPLQTKLKTLMIWCDISAPDVRKLVFWFPDVINAELCLDNESFRSVCEGWTKLLELEVLNEELTSEGITGIYDLRLRNSTEPPTDIEYNPVNITRLANLRKFVMNAEGNFKTLTEIDDVCVDEGFLKLPHLNYLEISTKHISEDGWKKLFNWPQLRTLIPFNGDYEGESYNSFRKRI